jgi:hypothetical protein
MTTDKQPAAGVMETDKGSQVSAGSPAGEQQDGKLNTSRPVATSTVRLAMGVSPAATHLGTYGSKDIQMQETGASSHQVQDPFQQGYLVGMQANTTGAIVDPDLMDGCSIDSQMDKQGNTSSQCLSCKS